ncbi:MAG: glycine--tRNA ligase [Bacilli bacterium]
MYSFEKIVNHLITSGFVFPGSEVYGGLANAWDYGPLGAELKRNVRDAWWKKFVTTNKYNVGIDSAIIMNTKVWEATGHITSFSDPLIDCKDCKSRFRADTLIEEEYPDVDVNSMNNADMVAFIKEKGLKCPHCGGNNFTDIRKFDLMFKTNMGVTDDSKSVVYLRPETAQGVFVNFKNVQRSTRRKLPFGICNTGKSFRNEITPGNFIFRTREFDQMECEFFCKPGTDLEWFAYWKEYCLKFVTSLGINNENIRFRDHELKELAFYSKATTDIEYKFPFGWGELLGVADRTDYDLKRHMEFSKQSLEYFDPDTNEKIIPYVVEPSMGLDRLMLCVLCDAYDEETLESGDIRTVLHLIPALAPYKAAILPLSKQLGEKANEIFDTLAKKHSVAYDDAGSIGKRYRRQDSIGTPLCITVDFDTATDGCVTIRDRDTMKQKRVKIEELSSEIDTICEF